MTLLTTTLNPVAEWAAGSRCHISRFRRKIQDFRSPGVITMMNSLAFHSLLFFVLSSSVSIGEETEKVLPTRNQLVKQLSGFVRSKLTFTKKNESVQMQAKPEAALPLELVAGKGYEASDGILSLGDGFTWPGCGFDRTIYTIKEIAPNHMVIGYTRGIPQRDGYQDAGEFKVSYGNQEEAAGTGKPATCPAPRSGG